MSCLGRPSNPALLRMRNVTFQPKPSKAKNRGWRAFQEALSPGAPGPASVGPRYPEAGSSLALKGVQRRLEVSLLAKSGRAEPAPGAAGAHRRPRAGCRSHGTPWGERSRTWGNRISSPLGRGCSARPHKAPFVKGPVSGAERSRRTIAQCCRPPGQALPVTPRPPKARKPGGAFL